jgi:Leucine-rich repeat (LRR) protein
LNVSHNKLKTIPFEIKRAVPSKKMDSFFAPTAERATQPLPALKILHASHNQLKSNSLQLGHFPKDLVEFDLSHNDLGPSGNLLNTLSTLGQLRTVKLTSCGLTDASFRAGSIHFKSLQTLNLGENDGLTEDAVKNSLVERTLEIGPTDSGLRGVLNVVIGKPGPAREAWEVEAEQRFRSRKVSGNPKNTSTFNIGNEPVPTKTPATKSTPAPPATSAPKTVRKSEEPPKEAWELEAEQGLLTEGGKRRARAAAAAAAAAGSAISPKALTKDLAGLPLSGNGNSSGSGEPPSLVQFYDGPHATLTLPKSQPQPRTHNRSFSVITASGPANAMNFVASPPTLPLPSILSQAFANSIRVLIVSSRRMDSSITLPSTGVSSAILPHLEELCMDNCNLASEVPISTENGFNSSNKAPLLETIAALFPSLNTLELSYNDLTTLTGLSTLLTPDAAKKRKGLKSLKLRGNHISSLEPLEELASVWRDGPGIEGWRGEEIDLRDNEIGRVSIASLYYYYYSVRLVSD